MGASGWNYFTPYQPSLAKALSDLQNRVFANKEYGNPMLKELPGRDEMLAGLPPEQQEVMKRMFEQHKAALDELARQRDEAPEPQTIDEAREQAAEDGTHSILDILGISSEADFGIAFPMPDDVMETLYGTRRPNHAQVEAKIHEASDDLERWQCWYVTVYEGDTPVEYYFEGCSGD